jgi:hypothetical protein
MYTRENCEEKFMENINVLKKIFLNGVTVEQIQEKFIEMFTIVFGVVINFIMRHIAKALFAYLTKINFFTKLVILINTV